MRGRLIYPQRDVWTLVQKRLIRSGWMRTFAAFYLDPPGERHVR